MASRRRTANRRANPRTTKVIAGLGLLALGAMGVAALAFASQIGSAPLIAAKNMIAAWSTKYSSVALTDTQRAFMDRVRANVPASIPLVVTSGERSPTAQAQVLVQKLQAGATLDEIRRLYGGSAAVSEMLARPTSEWASVIAAQVARGVFLSSHLKHGALDLSVKDASGAYLPADQQAAIVAGCKAAGARVAFVESHPPHIHVEIA